MMFWIVANEKEKTFYLQTKFVVILMYIQLPAVYCKYKLLVRLIGIFHIFFTKQLSFFCGFAFRFVLFQVW